MAEEWFPQETLQDRQMPAAGPRNAGRWAILGSDVLLEDGELRRDQAIMVEGGKITEIVARGQVERQRLQSYSCWDGRQFLVMPGLVNAHTHSPMGFFRGFGHGQPQMIENFLFPAEKALVPELTETLSYSYIWSALASGCTHLVDHYYFSEGVGRAMELLGLRCTLGECVADLGGAFPGRESWERAKSLWENWPFGDRIQPCVAPHAADTVSFALLQEMAAFARNQKLPLHMHLAQTGGERERVLRRENCSPVTYAAKAGALSSRTLAVHLVAVDAEDLLLLKQQGVTAVICPQSEVIYERLPPIAAIHRAGIPIALATDCAASNDSADMLAETKFFGMVMKMEGCPLAASELLRMAWGTVRQSLGLAGPGGMRVGALADMVFLRQTVDLLPTTAAAAAVAYSANSRHVSHVMVGGEWIVWDQQPTRVSLQDMALRYEEALAVLAPKVRFGR